MLSENPHIYVKESERKIRIFMWKNDKINMHGWGKWDILDIIYFLSALHAACTVKEKMN